MADEANAPVAIDATNVEEGTTRSPGGAADSAVAHAKGAIPADGAITNEAVDESKPSSTAADASGDGKTKTDATADATKTGDEAATALATDADANGTPASKKANNNRRKSGAGVPEHKKKTPAKKKAAPELHLNVQPGEMWFVSMKGYPPWPVIVCDEEMLPEALLSKRPVSARRLDGTYRDDFLEGGKNAKDRRYPVMFLSTNEFAWQGNTDMLPLSIDEVKKEIEAGNTQKKTKALWDAYQIASEGHDLKYFKELLENFEKSKEAEDAEKAAAKAKKLEKKTKGKTTSSDATEDVEMEDVDADGAASAKKAKPSKKRKKDTESDDEPEKPAKTPKTKLKLTNKTPNEASATKPKKESKPKKSKAKSGSEDAEPVVEAVKVEEKPLTEAERREKTEKSVLYLRHRLQKGFLTRDNPPKEEDMGGLSGHLKQLEDVKDLDGKVIRKTKVHKVLKAIVKLEQIPRDHEFHFKTRSNNLLQVYNTVLAADTDEPAEASATAIAPTTNGVTQNGEKKDGITTSTTDQAEEVPTGSDTVTATNGAGDVSMVDAEAEPTATKPDTAPSAEAVEEAGTV